MGGIWSIDGMKSNEDVHKTRRCRPAELRADHHTLRACRSASCNDLAVLLVVEHSGRSCLKAACKSSHHELPRQAAVGSARRHRQEVQSGRGGKAQGLGHEGSLALGA